MVVLETHLVIAKIKKLTTVSFQFLKGEHLLRRSRSRRL